MAAAAAAAATAAGEVARHSCAYRVWDSLARHGEAALSQRPSSIHSSNGIPTTRLSAAPAAPLAEPASRKSPKRGGPRRSNPSGGGGCGGGDMGMSLNPPPSLQEGDIEETTPSLRRLPSRLPVPSRCMPGGYSSLPASQQPTPQPTPQAAAAATAERTPPSESCCSLRLSLNEQMGASGGVAKGPRGTVRKCSRRRHTTMVTRTEFREIVAARSDLRPIDPARMVSPQSREQGTSELQLRPDRRQVSVLLNDDELERLQRGRG